MSTDQVTEVKNPPVEKRKVLRLKMRTDTEKSTTNFLSRQIDRKQNTKNNVDLKEILKIVEKKRQKPLG